MTFQNVYDPDHKSVPSSSGLRRCGATDNAPTIVATDLGTRRDLATAIMQEHENVNTENIHVAI